MLERRLRLWTGLILATYVVLHLTNHTFGLLSLDAMEAFRYFNASVWQNPVGTFALYGSLATHFLLALRSLYRRRTLRMPAWEATQISLGLLIPVLLAGHVIGTRINQELLEFDVTYRYVVTVLWTDPWYRIKQPILLLVVWGHLCVGLHYWLRLQRWYPKAWPYLYALAVLLPALALLGFVRAGFEADELTLDPDARQAIFAGWNAATADERQLILGLEPKVLGVLAGLLVAVFGARLLRRTLQRRKPSYHIHHSSGQTVTAPIGQTVLEAMRAAHIPHASVCGGRARCTTCRIRVGEGLDDLTPPSGIEAVALRRINAAPNVRLACQTRPRRDVSITPLLPAQQDLMEAYRFGGVTGRERRVAIMFVDLRGSTRLAEDRLPYDVVFILNQYFAEMSAALEATGGHYAQFHGDGLLGLYGLRTSLKTGCRQALQGAVAMAQRLAALNERLAGELSEPLRIGIGIHSGEAIVGTMGPPSSPNFSAIGDNVNIAARLEDQSKVFDCTLVVSTVTAEHAEVDLSGFPRHEAPVRGRGEPIAVYAIPDPTQLPGVNAQANGQRARSNSGATSS